MINKKCQVFTPQENVKQLLDSVGYVKNLYNQKIAENSCGDGNILAEIVNRYINDCINIGLSSEQISKGLEVDIYGAEIDEKHINNCKNKLNEIVKNYNIREPIKWNIFHGDFLKQKITNEFDFVVGNPPYISYLELIQENRDYLRENFESCRIGKFDYCYAFIEAGINSLKTGGKLAYLIPSNIYKNEYASALRRLLITGLTDIFDFKGSKLFEDKLTASSIFIFNRGNEQSDIIYHDMVTNTNINIRKSELINKWQFEKSRYHSIPQSVVRFGDYFHTAISIATLLNEVFIISDFEEDDKYIITRGQKIEKLLLRNAVSPRSMNYRKKEYLVFPYYYIDNKLQRYSSEDFMKKFPYGAQYLLGYKEKLSNRDCDKNINWFEYGRSQALSHLNQPKLMISTLVTNKVKTYLLDAEIIPTSGLYIISNGDFQLETAQKILESQCFYEYAKNIGVISNGNSYRISPKDINNYIFDKRFLK